MDHPPSSSSMDVSIPTGSLGNNSNGSDVAVAEKPASDFEISYVPAAAAEPLADPPENAVNDDTDIAKNDQQEGKGIDAMHISVPMPTSVPGEIRGDAAVNPSQKSTLDLAQVEEVQESVEDMAEPTLHEHHHPYHSLGSCRSIEEASVNTTIESVTMEEAENEEVFTDEIRPSLSLESVVEEHESIHSAPSDYHNVNLRLSPEEERLFQLLTNAAEAYEAGTLTIEPNPSDASLSARGGFTKQESNIEDASWLKLPPKVDKIEIRVAGGWVRDKLLNQHSVDVDVALDCMMGVQFARIVQAYLALEQKELEKKIADEKANQPNEGQSNANEAEDVKSEDSKTASDTSSKAGKQAKKSKRKQKKSGQPKIGVIGANPSQSKHLETATMNIHGIDVDFVNLRAEEVYELNSRIPTSKTKMFGTPLEDALRRDFTINSLFYNIRSHKVEDWTGRGLDDLLSHRLVVTPVDPHVTFHDDPLRVLRAIRFCVRLDFTLDDAIKEAAMSKRVHHSLHVKVSRERVGKELEGMLTGKHARPGRALDMIADLHLSGSVFAFPGSFPGEHDYAGGPVTGDILGVTYNCSLGTDSPHAIERAAKQRAMGWDESSSLLDLLPTVMEGHVDEREKILRDKSENEDGKAATLLPTTVDTRLLHLCVYMLPFHNLSFPDKKGREISVTAQMVKEALKFPIRDIQAVSKILSNVDEMTTILSEIRAQLAAQQNEDGAPIRLSPPCRLRAGLLLRELKENWVTCLLTASAWEIRVSKRQQNNGDDSESAFTSVLAEQPSREIYRAVVDDLDLDECWCVKPHLNGKDIIKELSLPKGPLVGVYLEDQTKWMLLNPEGTKVECTSHLHEQKRKREQETAGTGDIVDDQNEVNVGVANGEGQKLEGENGKHLSKKFRSET